MSDATDKLFESYISNTLLKEGGEKYTNDPADHGGATKWGVTENRARSAGYRGDMHDLTKADALHIYKLFFWEQPMFDKIALIAPRIGSLLLDLGINYGPTVPSRFLQRSLNALNNMATLYPDLTVDGVAGAATRYALTRYLSRRGTEGEEVLAKTIQALAAYRYVELAEANPTQERFLYGWLSQRAFGA